MPVPIEPSDESPTVGWLAATRRRLVSGVRLARHPHAHRTRRLLGVFAVAAAGVVLGVLLGGPVSQDVGPFRAKFEVTPTVSGGTEVAIPPLGALHLRTHAGPAHLAIRLETLDQERTKDLVSNPHTLAHASDSAVEDLREGVMRVVFHVAGVSVLGAMLLGALVYRSMRRIAACGGMSLAVIASTALVGLGTFRASAIEEPRYEGLLTNAPAVVGDARRIAGRFEEYRGELQRLVQNVGRLYGTISELPVYEPDDATIRVLHVSDMHLNPAAWGVVRTVVQQFRIDVIVDTGDMTDWGSEAESSSYVGAITALKVPYVFIRGNHDSDLTAAAVARQPNATVVDGTAVTVGGLTVGGIADPRFTPDKSATENAPGATDATRKLVRAAGERLAESFVRLKEPPDLVLVHDPISAEPLAGRCPVVLGGHRHKREVRRLDRRAGEPADTPRTLLMVQGSTGGAGLRGLEKRDPLPLALSVLYFDQSRKLQAYDDIAVGGTGLTEVTLERHVVKDDPESEPSRSPTAAPTTTPTP